MIGNAIIIFLFTWPAGYVTWTWITDRGADFSKPEEPHHLTTRDK